MKLYFIGFSAVLVLLIVSSCSRPEKMTDNDVQFDTISLTKNYHLENDSTLPSCNLKISYIYPVSYSGSELLPAIQKIFLTTFFDEVYGEMSPQKALETYAENYINNYKEDASNFFNEERYNHNPENNDKYFSYYEKLSNNVSFNKGNLLSLQTVRANYKGGNNSFQQYMNYVIDLKEGKLLNEKDIFTPEFEKALNLIFIEKLREANNNLSIAEMEDVGYFGLEEIAPNNNFLVDDNGITYIFNKGEYSILQLDEISIFLPYKEISNLIKENSPVSVFYKQ